MMRSIKNVLRILSAVTALIAIVLTPYFGYRWFMTDTSNPEAMYYFMTAFVAFIAALFLWLYGLVAVMEAAHNDLCACDPCRDRRMSQWRMGYERSPDGAWIIPTLYSCGDHLEYTRHLHPGNRVALDGKRCLYCKAR